MLLYILNSNEEVIQVLNDNNQTVGLHFFDAVTNEKINQGTTLKFNIDVSEEGSENIVEENFVILKDLKDNFHMFIIKEVIDLHGTGFEKEVYCEYASIELNDEIVLENLTGSLKPEAVLTHVLQNTRWSVGNYPNVYVRNFTEELKLKTALNCAYTVADFYELEIKFRITFSGNRVTGRYIDLVLPEVADDLGKRFEYSKDIETIKRTTNAQDVKTALICYGAEITVEGQDANTPKQRVSIENIVWDTLQGKPVDKPLGQIYIEDKTATQQWGYKNPDGTKRPRFAVAIMDKVESPEELANLTWLQLQRLSKPKVTYEISAVDLYALTGNSELSFESVKCGDIVTIVDHEFKPALTLKARIIEVERDLHSPENTKVTIGNFIETIVDKDLKSQLEDLKLNVSSVANDIPDLTVIKANIEGIDNKLGNGVWDTVQPINQQLFEEAVGFHYMENGQGIWVYDAPADQQPTKAIVLKGGQLGVARYDIQLQKWVVGSFIDGDSINASMINTGHLKGDLIEAGTLTTEAFVLADRTKINSIDGKADIGYVDTQITAVQGEITSKVSSVTTQIETVAQQVTYKVDIISTNGNVFKNGQIGTKLIARVYHGSEDVTDTIDANRFRWTRVSADASGDIAWNTAHYGGTKEINITTADVYTRATFNCEILEP